MTQDSALVVAVAKIINDGYGDPRHTVPTAANAHWQSALRKARQVVALVETSAP